MESMNIVAAPSPPVSLADSLPLLRLAAFTNWAWRAGCTSWPAPWIGLLYYFNLVQIPGLADGRAPTRAAPAAPASASTSRRARCCGSAGPRWPPGSPAPGTSRARAISPAPSRSASATPVNYYQLIIGIGAWLGTIMLFNVWVLIWPNQKKILGIVAATRRREGQGPQGRHARLAHQLRAVDPDAAVHGFGHARPAVLTTALSRRRRPDTEPNRSPGHWPRTSARATSPRPWFPPAARVAPR